MNKFQTDEVQRKHFPLKAFTFYFWTEEGHIASALLTVISPNRSWLSHQIRSNMYMQLFCDVDYYPLGPSRDWTLIAKFYSSQNRGLELKVVIWPHRPPSGFCPKMKIWVFVASFLPTACQSFIDDQTQRVSFVCCANSWNCMYEWCRCKCVFIIWVISKAEVWFLLWKESVLEWA